MVSSDARGNGSDTLHMSEYHWGHSREYWEHLQPSKFPGCSEDTLHIAMGIHRHTPSRNVSSTHTTYLAAQNRQTHSALTLPIGILRPKQYPQLLSMFGLAC